MPGNISRRTFLRGGLAAACSIAASGAPAKAAIADGMQHIATLIDISKCIGCEECVEACRATNSSRYPRPQKPFPKMVPARVPVEDWSEKQEVTDRLTPYNWLFIQHAVVRIDGKETELTIPRRCMHCINPPCVKLCPWGAARQYENGISAIDPDMCLGGSKCRNVCPWHIPRRQTGVGLYLDLLPSFAGNGVLYKCDRCYEQIVNGGLPACIEACPEGVQTVGPREMIIRTAHERAREINGYIYGETENGGTNTLYVSPVPFEAIDAALQKGRDIPHFKAVPDSMAQANNLVAAMALAPVAGIAVAAGKFYHRIKTAEQGDADESR